MSAPVARSDQALPMRRKDSSGAPVAGSILSVPACMATRAVALLVLALFAGASSGAPPPGRFHSGSLTDLHRWLREQHGHPVVLAFWATWCAPCVEETPTLNEALQRFRAEKLAVMGVSLDGLTAGDPKRGREKVAEFLRRHRVSYDTFYYEGDPEPLGEAFDLPGPIPYIIILDAQGRAKQKLMGSIPPETLLNRIGEAIGADKREADGRPRQKAHAR